MDQRTGLDRPIVLIHQGVAFPDTIKYSSPSVCGCLFPSPTSHAKLVYPGSHGGYVENARSGELPTAHRLQTLHVCQSKLFRAYSLMHVNTVDIPLSSGYSHNRTHVVRLSADLARYRKTGRIRPHMFLPCRGTAWKVPKTKHSRRQIALPASVAELLRRRQRHQAAERMRLGAWWEDYDLVFCTHTGGPLIPGNIYRQLMRVLKWAGLPHIRFHDLRHAAATLLLSARVNPKVASEMLGHA